MAVNVIVGAVTLLMLGFVAVWLLYPRSRRWIEAPKYQPLLLMRGSELTFCQLWPASSDRYSPRSLSSFASTRA